MGADVGDFEEVATIPCDSPPGITTLAVPINQDQAILDLFLQSLAATEASGCHVIFVVDGGCTATVDALVGWTAALSSKATAAKIFVNRHPKGWGRCISFAMEMCKSEFLVTLDSDLVLIPGWLDQLIAVATARANVGAVGGVLLYPQTGGIQHCGLAFTEDVGRHLHLNADRSVLPAEPYAVQAVVGAMCCFRMQVVRETGLMDCGYFNAYEDLDYCQRIIAGGYEVIVAPRAVSYHWERSSGIHRAFNRRANLARFWKKWGGRLQPDLWRYLERSVMRMARDSPDCLTHTYVGVDLCQARADARNIWPTLNRAGFAVAHVVDASACIPDEGDIWLPRVLGHDGHRERRPYVMAVDNFVRLLGNSYWAEIRRQFNGNDIVVDLYANVLPLQRLQRQSWPGVKVR